MDYFVTDYGAIGDGKTLNTDSINRAISACNAGGGGRVILPSGGTYVSGTVWLKSNVELHVEAGAVLRGSDDMSDYCSDDAYEQNFAVPSEMWNGAHLIVALECENIAFSGRGTIDGNARHFVTEKDMRPYSPWLAFAWQHGFALSERPGQTVSVVECKNVTVKDITFKDLPSWCLFLHGCDNVQISGIKISNPPYVGNTDGIDIDSCRFVTVSDCLIDTGDDAIAIRNASNRLKNKDRVCEYITVTNCVLSSCANIFRIGVGNSVIQHIRVSNIVVKEGANLIDFTTEYAGQPMTPIYDVNFSNISAVGLIKVVDMSGSFGIPVRHVTIENVRAEAAIGMVISNEKEDAVEDITVRNVDIFVTDLKAELTPEVKKLRGDALIKAKNVKGLLLDGVRLFIPDEIRSKWEYVSEIDACPDAIVRNCNLE